MPNDQQKAQLRELMDLRDEYKSDPTTPDFVFDDIQEAMDNLLTHGRMFAFEIREAGSETQEEKGEYLTVKEAATDLRCSTQSVRDMIKSGKLKATEIGTGTQRKAYTIRRSDLETLAKVHEEQPVKPRRRNTSGSSDNRWGL